MQRQLSIKTEKKKRADCRNKSGTKYKNSKKIKNQLLKEEITSNK